MISKDTVVSMDVRQRVSEGEVKSIWRVNEVGMNVKNGLYESIVVPTVLHGGEPWG